ncbi:YfbM family protein [Glycomyces buryatensis]|uniref:DUF1877 family protein n=1 Tax=Glycomyces buryatensis TaxID=2570927 RepID=A0A4S8Q8Y6_9ACTN|nr:YfbM family protein [Glycomyces buryatensis]THV40650.1 DUF1877 family protein [Glycomyces buryatensis]
MGMTISFTSVTRQELEKALADPEWAEELLWQDEKAEQEPDGYLDKSWAGLEYLMGEAGVGFEFLFEGVNIDEEGTLFAWSPELVRQTAEELRAVPFERLAAHYDGPAMEAADVYPRVWEVGASLDYEEFHYVRMVAFFEAAAASGAGAIMNFSF